MASGREVSSPSAAGAASGCSAVVVERIVVRAGRIVCAVQVPNPADRTVGDRLASKVAEARPDLARHACVNGTCDTFGPVMATTSLPHLVEHVAIDIETHEAAGMHDDALFVGATRWVDEAAGRAEIELSFVDDLRTLNAFTRAVDFVNAQVRTLASESV